MKLLIIYDEVVHEKVHDQHRQMETGCSEREAMTGTADPLNHPASVLQLWGVMTYNWYWACSLQHVRVYLYRIEAQKYIFIPLPGHLTLQETVG